MTINYIKTPNTVTVIIHDKPYQIDSKHLNYESVLEIVTQDEMISSEALIAMMKPIEYVKEIIKINGAKFAFKDGQLTCTVEKQIITLPYNLYKEIVRVHKAGGVLTPLFNFVRKLAFNPDKRAMEELYGFISACGLAITESGNFLAYKAVNPDFTDRFSGKMDNSPGKAVKMLRMSVDNDKHRTCSAGLHFAAWDYAKMFAGGSGKLLILSINPKHVVAIPTDYHNQKGRACKYKVLREVAYNEELSTKPVWSDEAD